MEELVADVGVILRGQLTETGLTRILSRKGIDPAKVKTWSIDELGRAVSRNVGARLVPRTSRARKSSSSTGIKKKRKMAVTAARASHVKHPNFWLRVKQEIRVLICTNDKQYADLRRQIKTAGNKSQTVIVGLITAAIAA